MKRSHTPQPALATHPAAPQGSGTGFSARTQYPVQAHPVQRMSAALAERFGADIRTWTVLNIRALSADDIASLDQADFGALSAEQLAAFTSAQHQAFSANQIGWYNTALKAKGQPEVNAAHPSQGETIMEDDGQTKVSFNARGAKNAPFYQEVQTQGWCGKHALNAFLGGNVYTPESIWKLAVEKYGTKENAANYVRMEDADENKIGDVSLDLLIWILETKHNIPMVDVDLGQLSDEALEASLADINSLMMYADGKRKFPGETLHAHGHYAAAKKDQTDNWWAVNSTAADQPQVDPKHYSKGLHLLLPVTLRGAMARFKDYVTTLSPLWTGAMQVTFQEWQADKGMRSDTERLVRAAITEAENINRAAGQELIPPRVMEFIQEVMPAAVHEDVQFLEENGWAATTVFDGTENAFSVFVGALGAFQNYMAL